MSACSNVMQKLKDAHARVEMMDFNEMWIMMDTGDVLPITGVFDAFDQEVEDPFDNVEDIVMVEFGSEEIGYAQMVNKPGNLYRLEEQ